MRQKNGQGIEQQPEMIILTSFFWNFYLLSFWLVDNYPIAWVLRRILVDLDAWSEEELCSLWRYKLKLHKTLYDRRSPFTSLPSAAKQSRPSTVNESCSIDGRDFGISPLIFWFLPIATLERNINLLENSEHTWHKNAYLHSVENWAALMSLNIS